MTKAEDQQARAHVTEAVFALTLDTPVRRWVEGTGLGLGLGLDEAARTLSGGRAMSAIELAAVQQKQCSQAIINNKITKLKTTVYVPLLFYGPCCTTALAAPVRGSSGATERLAVVVCAFLLLTHRWPTTSRPRC